MAKQAVFLSYARRTGGPGVRALHRELGEKVCFLDAEDVETADCFPQRLSDALLDAKVVVAFVDAALSFATTPSGPRTNYRDFPQPLRQGEERVDVLPNWAVGTRKAEHTTQRRGGSHRTTVGAGGRALARVAGRAERSYAARRTYR